ncbi:T6SS effector amidase Tae4 family protein [Superficieibacter sp.]|uniref:T6SS effector amidase Tae4 family protein n=1 Tax=Superficieibacter sp. TaxID=2303322 RepID=UPI0028A5F913|nr:T6SS effector amidase Tae4 family protein [Superficieibacter sp.]
MKPLYNQLKQNHYSSNSTKANYLSPTALYTQLGFSEKEVQELTKDTSPYYNTCAVRMSLALLKCGVPFQGRMLLKGGAFKGKKIEPGAKLLADQLVKASAFGWPEIFHKPQEASQSLKNRTGVVFFNAIEGYGGGHIDLVETEGNHLECHSDCYPTCREIWFWELK